MKNKNKVKLAVVILVFISFSLSAQNEYRIKLDNISGKGKLSISNLMGSLSIKSHRGNDIIIKYDKEKIEKELKKIPNKAKGLKPLSHEYSNDTGLGFIVSTDHNDISIIGSPFKLFSGLFDNDEEVTNVPDYKILIPEEIKMVVVNGGQFIFHPDNDRTRLVIEDLSSEIVVNAFGGGVLIKDISGPATINSISGAIKVTFSEIDQDSPISITSTNGDIDVTIPKRTSANVNFNAILGEVFTDFDVEIKGEKKEPKYDIPLISTQNIRLHGKINGGGVSINLTAIYGNIYLRKK